MPLPDILVDDKMHQVNQRGEDNGQAYLVNILHHPYLDHLVKRPVPQPVKSHKKYKKAIDHLGNNG